ncbi:MAG: RHS repeat-associated core domain-containing protein [Oscillospiraceae bacterium]|nr:RHS repeat-associated core domain-containing protein [Oscillospiraceae bacterium]
MVHKDYVVDYTSRARNVLMEYESGTEGLMYRYTYGLEKNNVVICGIPNGVGNIMQNQAYPDGEKNIVKLYYHHDRLGSSDYLTNNLDGKVESYVSYDDWGEPTMKPILKMGVRQLDLVTEYTGYAYDAVLGAYYAKARIYDAENRRFMAADPVKGTVGNAQTMAQYTYCLNNPVRYVDPLGLAVTDWDREHLSASEIAAVEKATAEWVSANASGDQKGKEAAHDAAEAIREQYRTGTERGSDNKDGNTVGTPDVTKPPKNEPVDTSTLGDNERNILEEYAGIVNSYSDGDLLDLVSSYDSELVEKIYAVIGSLGAGGKARAAAMLRQQLIRDAANALVNWHSSNIVDPLSDEPMQYVAYDVGKSANKVEVNPLIEFNKLLDDNDKFYKINNINYKGAPHYNAEEIFAAIGGELFKKQENAEFMFTQVSYGGSIVTFKYDLSSIPKNGNKNCSLRR